MTTAGTQDPGEGGAQGLGEVRKDYGVTTPAGWGIPRTNSHFS